MSLNVIVLSGRLGKDPEMRYTSTGKAVCNFPVAVRLGPENTMWVDVTAWGNQAENSNKYLNKGSEVAISGYLAQDTWEGDDGKKRTKKYVVANSVQFMSSSKGSSGNESQATKESKPAEDVDDLLDGAEDLDEYDFPL